MKTVISSIVLIFTFCFLLHAKKGNAQTCTASFNYTGLSLGLVSYTSTSLGTNSTTTYFWNFGNGTTFSTTGISATNNFTANGIYSVSLFISTSLPSCTAIVTQTVAVFSASCGANFISASSTAGVVNFTSTSLNTSSTTTYFWNFGDGTSYSSAGNPGIFPAATYTANGIYSVTLSISSLTPSCSSSITKTISVTTVTPCNIIPAFSFTNNAAGSVNFQSTSTGTNASTSYTWMYGDSSPNSSGVALSQISHTYGVNGTYSVGLFLANTSTPSCAADTTIIVTVTNSSVGCSLTANFSYTTLGNGNYQFQNTSNGTVSATSYLWDFGDGTTLSGLNAFPIHQYSVSGNYIMTLTANNNFSPTCLATTTQSILVSFSPCSLTANFSHTVGSSGVVNFNNSSVGIYSNTVYTWDFGDGVYSNTKSPTHTI
jgi:PKD repeat protein